MRPFPSLRLAGATWLDRALACCGALFGIGGTGYLCTLLAPKIPLAALAPLAEPLIIAPLGASAVLLFAVPASPLAQPWSIIGGNTISALVGVTICLFVHQPFAAIALAVAGAIAAMSLTRSLHPPGGAVALGTVLAWKQIAALGYLYPLVPVCLNSTIIVAIGLAFHRISGHAYPHRVPPPAPNIHGTRDTPPERRTGIQEQDIEAALADLHETFDIERGDVATLVRQVEARALERTHGAPSCADIMSRDIISVTEDTAPAEALRLLLKHNFTALPVTDRERHVRGFIDLRGLALARDDLAAMMLPARTVRPDLPAVDLVPLMTDAATHPVAVTNRDGRMIGIIAPTDLLVALASIATAQETV